MKKYCFLTISIVVLILSCRKTDSTISPIEVSTVPKSVRINDLQIINDSLWYACGGVRDMEGHIFKSTDAGKTWSVFTNEFSKSIYCIHFPTPEIGMAGGDFLHLWRTTDGGNTWEFQWLADQVPLHEEDRPAIRDLQMLSPVDFHFCGGENLGEGVIYETHNGGENWNFEFMQHEMRTLAVGEGYNVVAGGHGAAFHFADSLSSIEQSDFENDFITDLVHAYADDFYAASYNGAIYRSEDNGHTWTEIFDSNSFAQKRINWNAIHLVSGLITVVGNGGWIVQSEDAGANWQLLRLDNEDNLYCIAALNEQLWTGSDNGKLYRIQ
ncbi:MAG: WD40/YVTN/BNR-like repeat-containing protein [Flavobacteriales bacterium]